MEKAPLVLFFYLLITTALYSNDFGKYLYYADPVPNAELVNKETNIIIKPTNLIDKTTLSSDGSISLTGSESGDVRFSVIVCEQNSVFILKPNKPFRMGESVTIRFNNTIKTSAGKKIKPFSYSFRIKSVEINPEQLIGLRGELSNEKIDRLIKWNQKNDYSGGIPDITVTYDDQPATGYLFLSNVVFDPNINNFPNLLILNNNGSVFYNHEVEHEAWDFDKQPNGMMTYYDQYYAKFYGLDNNYNIIDSFSTGNNYVADLHEFRLLGNGHALLLSYDPEIVDMSLIVPGGNPAASVVGLIIQELDENKNVVFQWRSWDHFLITDATHENLLAYYIDYVHGNALESDNDGNILLSSRHMDEITKINRSTGSIIWRMGGKHNQFTFINDATGFSHQHAIRRISNGDITLFDNGNFHTPPRSRAVEYSIDEVTKTATLVWQYRHNPDVYSYAMGFVQRLPNNNTLISWGAANPTLTEVRYDGTKEYELTFDPGVYSYRCFRYHLGDTLVGLTGNSGGPGSFSLDQNYPNPFNPSTLIRFEIPSGSSGGTQNVKLVIYDELGREAATLIDKKMEAGKYQVNWLASNYASGVYFYRLTVSDEQLTKFSSTKKLILIK